LPQGVLRNRPRKHREKLDGENTPERTTSQTESWDEIEKMEASIEGATRGTGATVFKVVGLTTRKSLTTQRETKRP